MTAVPPIPGCSRPNTAHAISKQVNSRSNNISSCGDHRKGADICWYTYENICLETGAPLNDRAKRIFLNAEGTDHSISAELRELLDYVKDNKPRGSLTRRIEKQVRQNRKDVKLRMDYIPYQLELEHYRKEGELRGEKRGIKKSIKKLSKFYLAENPSLTEKEALKLAKQILG